MEKEIVSGIELQRQICNVEGLPIMVDVPDIFHFRRYPYKIGILDVYPDIDMSTLISMIHERVELSQKGVIRIITSMNELRSPGDGYYDEDDDEEDEDDDT